MSSPADDAGEGPYVLAVEERFRALRETPLLLSPADFQRVLTWYRDGVPLFLVLQALEDAFRKGAERKPPRTPRSLAFVAPMVRERFADWKEARAGAHGAGEQGGFTEADRALFEQAAAAIEASDAPAGARADAARALRAGGSPSAISAALAAACLAALPEGQRAELDAVARADIAPLAADMTPEIRARAEAAALARRVRARFRLPDLALLPGL